MCYDAYKRALAIHTDAVGKRGGDTLDARALTRSLPFHAEAVKPAGVAANPGAAMALGGAPHARAAPDVRFQKAGTTGGAGRVALDLTLRAGRTGTDAGARKRQARPQQDDAGGRNDRTFGN